jgi:hypothetical protein
MVSKLYLMMHIDVFTLSTTCNERVFFFLVYWSCQFIARPSNTSLKHWEQMGGVSINEDIVIDKSIHKSINSRSAVLKVKIFQLPTTFIGVLIVTLYKEDVTTQYQYCMLVSKEKIRN